jgi:hypothetical protein
MSRLTIAFKALRQLGPLRLGENGLYRLGLALDLWKTPVPRPGTAFPLNLKALPVGLSCFPDDCKSETLLQEAREILSGQVRLFGGPPLALQLAPPPPLRPWVDYERGRAAWGAADVKFIWEPARFGWAVTLARAYRMTGDEAFANCFWRNLEAFLAANPPYLGPNWTSGQEVALRLLVWAFVLPALAASPESTPSRLTQLAQAIGQHAARIPPTLLYARSQDNNHLLSEAAGSYTAGVLLPDHPAAAGWRQTGWAWFNRALQRQIEPDGTYIQQSLNYHRLILQLALWVDTLARQQDEIWPPTSRERLSAATNWLLARLDRESGHAPNFGHNDGAYIFPFGTFSDQRPVAQAAALAFLGAPALEEGEWDELSGWLGMLAEGCRLPSPPTPLPKKARSERTSPPAHPLKGRGARDGASISAAKATEKSTLCPLPLRGGPGRGSVLAPLAFLGRGAGGEGKQQSGDTLPENAREESIRDSSGIILRTENTWAMLRAAHFSRRPGQADQLHLDLWHAGQNITLDPGTYRYNAAPPWDNALAGAAVHNTVTVDGCEPMTRAGRFLWLDWDQAEVLSLAPDKVVVQRSGYRKLGVVHRRTVEYQTPDCWQVTDELLPVANGSQLHDLTLHWLFPDGDWAWVGNSLRLTALGLDVTITTSSSGPIVQIIRAGEMIYGGGPILPVLGWYSPTYASREPALSLRVIMTAAALPVKLVTVFNFQ